MACIHHMATHEMEGMSNSLGRSHSSIHACIGVAQTQMLTNVAMQISKIISDVVSSKLGVPSDRFYLSVSLCCASACSICTVCQTNSARDWVTN